VSREVLGGISAIGVSSTLIAIREFCEIREIRVSFC
jgi:hypothetical protein